jgi:hypothetical protein
LKNLASDIEAKRTVEGRLRLKIQDIIAAIKRCSALCDSYQSLNAASSPFSVLSAKLSHVLRAVRFCKASRWQEKFAAAGTELDTLKGNLMVDLQIQASVTNTDMKTTLARVQQDVSASVSLLMALVFQKLRSPEERELSAFVEKQGGVDKVVASDSLLSFLFVQATSRAERLGKDARDANVKKSPSDLRQEIEKDPDDFVKADAKTFENKFDALRSQIVDQVNQVVGHARDRIIDELNKGPHERILDPVDISSYTKARYLKCS